MIKYKLFTFLITCLVLSVLFTIYTRITINDYYTDQPTTVLVLEKHLEQSGKSNVNHIFVCQMNNRKFSLSVDSNTYYIHNTGEYISFNISKVDMGIVSDDMNKYESLKLIDIIIFIFTFFVMIYCGETDD